MRDGGSYACFGLKLHISRFSLVYVLNWLSKMKYLGIGVICAASLSHSTVFLLNFFSTTCWGALANFAEGEPRARKNACMYRYWCRTHLWYCGSTQAFPCRCRGMRGNEWHMVCMIFVLCVFVCLSEQCTLD